MRFRINGLKSFSELVRLEHGIMYGIGVFVGAILSGWKLSFSWPLLIGFAVAVLAEFGAFALNDFFDIVADTANKRTDRPIIRKDVSPDAAFIVSAASFALANMLAFVYLSGTAFQIVLALSVFSVLYNAVLKNLPLVGNVFIAATMAVPFIFGSILLGALSQPVIILSAIAFLVGIGREVMKDIEDIPGDRKVGARTLPILIGAKNSAYVTVLCYLLGVALSSVPFYTFFNGKILYLLVIATDVMLVEASFKLLGDQGIRTLRSGRKQTLYAVAVGLLAFLLAATI